MRLEKYGKIHAWKLVISLLFLIFCFSCRTSKLSIEEKSSFNMAEMLQKHLGDRYDWPLLGIDKPSLILPLPVIVYTSQHGLQLFSSSRISNGKSYKGFYLAVGGAYNGKIVYQLSDGKMTRPLDLSLTRNAAALLVSAIILLLIMIRWALHYRKHPLSMPSRFKGALEMLMNSLIDEVLKPCLGPYALKYAPYLLSLFFFILTINLLGLIVVFPGGVNLSGNISVCMVLAGCTLVLTIFAATRRYWKEIFWPDVPAWLNSPIPILTFIELIGIFTKPMALMVRMFANLLGGHIIMLVLAGLVFLFIPFGLFVVGSATVLMYFFSVFMLLIEVLVCLIQAYVFFMLTTLFIGLTKV